MHRHFDRDVESIGAVEELHAPQRVGMTGVGHLVDFDRGLVPLELVDRSNPRAWQAILQLDPRALQAALIRMSSSVSGFSVPSRSIHVGLEFMISSTRPMIATASSGEKL